MGIPYAEVIGDPIAHSKSPLIHKFWLEKLGIEGDYRATRVGADELPAYLESRRADPDWRGCNVTLPHKQSVMRLLDVVDEYGIGAVNCVLPSDRGLIGRNTDSDGVSGAIMAVDTAAPVCLIGAGGAARAAIAWLDILAVYQFNVIVRDRGRGEALLKEHGMAGTVFSFDEAENALRGCVGVVNATPLGMAGFPEMPEALLHGLSGVRRRGFALDMVYNPLPTRFLECAERARLVTKDGLVVLVGQAASAFAYFFEAEAPREYDNALRKRLTA